MNWTELLKTRIEDTYRATEGLVGMVEDKSLGWKPATGSNWMTTGQLLKHIETACGACCKGFATGDWSFAGEDMVPTADKMPTTKSVAETKKALAADKKLALQMVVETGGKNLGGKKVAAPWDPTERALGEQFLNMLGHLGTHEAQLFYYLSLLGKLLRIDVESGATTYVVPADNPFVGNSAYRSEVWALGLRNPWRFSFDRLTGDLFIADVGQGSFDQVNFKPAPSPGGRNYGWNIMEGSHCFGTATCNQTGLTLPVHEYDHSQGCSITGGFVFRGPASPELPGKYLFGDYCSGRIWALEQMQGGWTSTSLADTAFAISSFGEDEAGNVSVADHDAGAIYQILGNASLSALH